jgi:hypothetical protein
MLRALDLDRPLFVCLLLGGLAGCDGSSTGSGGEDGGDGTEESGGSEGPQSDGCSPGEDPLLELGHGSTSFETLEDGEQLVLEHGVQGGVHTFMALHLERIDDSSDDLVAYLRGYLDGQLVATSSPILDLRCNPDSDGLEAWNILLIWDADPVALHEQTVTIEVELTDASGTEVTDTKEATIHDPLLE